MIPILFGATESEFTTNGIGRLSDAVSCVITEERNGIYELSMQYPMDGIHYAEIEEEKIIFAQPRPGASNQAFRIYEISKPIDGIITVNARHISYALNKTVVMPYTAGSCTAALAGINDHIVGTSPFTYWTDKSVTANFRLRTPSTVRAMLGGTEGSILDTFGTGEYEWDMYTVKFYLHRGQDNGVTIRYGKNLTDLKNETSTENVYTAIVPYYANETTVVTLPEGILYGEHISDYSEVMAVPVDLSSRFGETVPTEEQLRSAGTAYLNSSDNWRLGQNIEVSFVNLADTEEYKNVSALQRVNLCDTVKVIHPQLEVEATAKVIKVEYNVLVERYNSLELGDSTTNLSQAVIEASGLYNTVVTKTTLQTALEHATQLITGGLGGYVVLKPNADGVPEEILIMDSPDINTAVNVIRMNRNGIGFSNAGYNPAAFITAWTIDGGFSASFINSGVMNAQWITAGTIRDQAGKNWWNLEDGTMHISAESYIDTSDFVTKAELQVETDRIATEVVERVGSGIFFNCVPTDNANGTTTIHAHVFLNREDATQTFAPGFFNWWKKTEDGKAYLGYGYEITVVNNEYGYGGEIEGTFVILEDRYPINSQGKWVFTMYGNYYTMAVSQGTFVFSQGYPLVLAGASGSGAVYPVFGYDYY